MRLWNRIDDNGNATITTAGISAALVAVLLVVSAYVSGIIDQDKAQVAADLSAVAGAQLIANGNDQVSVCAQVEKIAALNNASAKSCVLEESDVIVGVEVHNKHARARAGPVN